MVCNVCKEMLEKHTNYRWKGTYDLAFDHHPDHKSLKVSAIENCCICRVLLSKFNTRPDADNESQNDKAGKKKREAFFTQASLSYNRQWSAYRLDIKLNERYNLERVGSFFLKELRKFVHC
ncbi:hypothetical protein EG329_000824 [Mollisiaceae sp. DMI_Dod_QoI]|nr:hypothetical protein EG329_000824 [Helotiales sp. DMI_Dod_QoI]